MAGTETAAFLERHRIGIVLPDIEPETLVRMIDSLDPKALHRLAEGVAALPRQVFAVEATDCRALVERLAALAGTEPEMRTAA